MSQITRTILNMPVKIGGVVGRITKLKGSTLEGVNSIIQVSTPHGSIIESGIVYVQECDENDIIRLDDFEKDAIAKGKTPYEPDRG